MTKQTKETNYLKIKVGDLVQNKENSKILKELFKKEKKKEEFDIQGLIDSCETKIKRPRFETNTRRYN